MPRLTNRHLALAAFAAFVLVNAYPPAYAASDASDLCAQLQPPSVTVKRRDEALVVSSEYGYRELTHLGADIAHKGNAVLGLTRGKTRVRFLIQTDRYVDRSGRWECASPKITVTYGFNPLAVYIAKEFPKGSCAYDEVLKHEMRHVDANRAHLAAIEPKIREALVKRFVTGDYWRGAVGSSTKQLQRERDARWLPFIRREIDRGTAAQAEIDSPAEYQRVSQACGGEIQRLTGDAPAKRR